MGATAHSVLPDEQELGNKGKQRALARPKKRKFRGNQHQVVDSGSSQSKEVETSQKSLSSASASATKLQILPPFQTSSRTSVLESGSSSPVDLSSEDDDDGGQDYNYSSDESDCTGDEFTSDESFLDDQELTGYRVVDINLLVKLIAQACSCKNCGGP